MKEKKKRLSLLCEAMLNEQSVYVKGSLLKEQYPNDPFEPNELYEVQIESVSRNETVTLFYVDEPMFCDSIYDVDEEEVYLTKDELNY